MMQPISAVICTHATTSCCACAKVTVLYLASDCGGDSVGVAITANISLYPHIHSVVRSALASPYGVASTATPGFAFSVYADWEGTVRLVVLHMSENRVTDVATIAGCTLITQYDMVTATIVSHHNHVIYTYNVPISF